LKPFDKVLSLLLITHYLLLQCFPGSGAFFIGNADCLVNGLVDLFSVAGSDYNASLVEDFLKMAKIARHLISPPPDFLSVIASPSAKDVAISQNHMPLRFFGRSAPSE
jgi:hypothetical protein